MNAALLVGINHYRAPGNDLRGCRNDVLNMKDLLVNTFHFSVLQISELTDAQATKKNIMKGLRQMVHQAKAGDHLLFHFSGHGSQVPDQDNDEEDFLDEVLCPHDLDWSGLYISDDDLRNVCMGLHSKATLDVLLDSCHSGTGLRMPGEIPKFIPSPFVFSP